MQLGNSHNIHSLLQTKVVPLEIKMNTIDAFTQKQNKFMVNYQNDPNLEKRGLCRCRGAL